MPARRLADRQIRAAQQAALRLDVRGPVSQALGNAGIVVPPADEPEAAAPVATPPSASRRRAEVAERVLKPVEAAPWPTRAGRDPLSGLTSDERRVHRILIDTLALQSHAGLGDGSGVTGLSYAERQALGSLDLDYIEGRLAAGASDDGQIPHTGLIAGLIALAAAAAGAFVQGWTVLAIVLVLLAVMALTIDGLLSVRTAALPAPRRKIYEALRELALLTDHGEATSVALSEADRLIDRIALDDAPAPASTPAARPRVRS